MIDSKIDVLLGLQWGDEGKGKIVDVFTPKYDIIARFQGGPNAGHTLEFDGKKHVLHTIPSGIFHLKTQNVIGNGVIIDLYIIKKELEYIEENGAKPSENLYISKKAHMILPTHRVLDYVYEQSKGDKKIGSTLKGIGPTYTDKVSRLGLRIGDLLSDNFKEKYENLKAKHIKIIESYNQNWESEVQLDKLDFTNYEQEWFSAIDKIKQMHLIESEYFINDALSNGKKILAEGAQGTLLDVDFGSYPFVTSSNTISAAVCSGLGVAPNKIGKVFGVFKAYCTRVGSGPFPSELFDEDGQKMRDNGHEYGSTTGRPRRCGWLDLPALKYSIMINGVSDLIITKADVLDDFDKIQVCTKYQINGKKFDYIPFDLIDSESKPEYLTLDAWNSDISDKKEIRELPENYLKYIKFIEEQTKTKISVLSLGPDRTQTIIR
jgi:adenylosuccinate synthase